MVPKNDPRMAMIHDLLSGQRGKRAHFGGYEEPGKPAVFDFIQKMIPMVRSSRMMEIRGDIKGK